LRIDSGLLTALFAASTARASSARTTSLVQASSKERLGRLWFFAQEEHLRVKGDQGADEGSLVAHHDALGHQRMSA
jgi:hypothetical protein